MLKRGVARGMSAWGLSTYVHVSSCGCPVCLQNLVQAVEHHGGHSAGEDDRHISEAISDLPLREAALLHAGTEKFLSC